MSQGLLPIKSRALGNHHGSIRASLKLRKLKILYYKEKKKKILFIKNHFLSSRKEAEILM